MLKLTRLVEWPSFLWQLFFIYTEPYYNSVLIVPKYEITPPFQADEDGSFLSHTLEEHARQKRETGEPRFWFYNVKAFGMSLHLNLTKNEQLMAPGMKVERHFNGTVTSEDPPKNSFLNGHVSSLAGSSVAVSNEEGLVSTELHCLFACFLFCFVFLFVVRSGLFTS